MSGKHRKQHLQPSTPSQAATFWPRYRWPYPFAFGCIFAGFAVFIATGQPHTRSATNTARPAAARPNLATLCELTGMSDDELSRQDLATVNLRCAEGLPGAEKLDLQKCLAILDQWTHRVRIETARHLYRAHDARYAKRYRNSEAYLKASMMIQVLQEDFGVKYNLERMRNIDFTNSEDLFIHGMVSGDNGGTCVSMPVLYTVIGRRLGYPIYLSTAKAHVFCRWDDGHERFNIEGSGTGFSSFDDEYYTKWPKPMSDEEIKAGLYLKSLSPGEELAVFLSARGHCLQDNGRSPEALVSYAQALQRRPDSPDYFSFVVTSVGFRQSPKVSQLVRQPLEPPMTYSAAFNPHSQPTGDQGTRWARPTIHGQKVAA